MALSYVRSVTASTRSKRAFGPNAHVAWLLLSNLTARLVPVSIDCVPQPSCSFDTRARQAAIPLGEAKLWNVSRIQGWRPIFSASLLVSRDIVLQYENPMRLNIQLAFSVFGATFVSLCVSPVHRVSVYCWCR